MVLLMAAAVTANGACSITSGDYTGQVGVAVVYQITVANGNPTSYNAATAEDHRARHGLESILSAEVLGGRAFASTPQGFETLGDA